MALHKREYPGQGVTSNQLTTCPLLEDGGPDACGYEFSKHEARWKHFFDEHGPLDADLSALGDRHRAGQPETVTSALIPAGD